MSIYNNCHSINYFWITYHNMYWICLLVVVMVNSWMKHLKGVNTINKLYLYNLQYQKCCLLKNIQSTSNYFNLYFSLSFYFMHVDLEKLFAEKTNISQSKESIEELPIPSITLCFINPNMRITKYEYVSDFIIRYEILVMKLYKTSIF